MTTIYNVQVAEIFIRAHKGTKIDKTFTVALNAVAESQAGKQLDLTVEDMLGTTIKHYSSVGTSPEITISTSSINITDATGFADVGTYTGYLINTTDNVPIAKIIFIIEEFVKPAAA